VAWRGVGRFSVRRATRRSDRCAARRRRTASRIEEAARGLDGARMAVAGLKTLAGVERAVKEMKKAAAKIDGNCSRRLRWTSRRRSADPRGRHRGRPPRRRAGRKALPPSDRPRWRRRLHRLAGDRPVAQAVGERRPRPFGDDLYEAGTGEPSQGSGARRRRGSVGRGGNDRYRAAERAQATRSSALASSSTKEAATTTASAPPDRRGDLRRRTAPRQRGRRRVRDSARWAGVRRPWRLRGARRSLRERPLRGGARSRAGGAARPPGRRKGGDVECPGGRRGAAGRSPRALVGGRNRHARRRIRRRRVPGGRSVRERGTGSGRGSSPTAGATIFTRPSGTRRAPRRITPWGRSSTCRGTTGTRSSHGGRRARLRVGLRGGCISRRVRERPLRAEPSRARSGDEEVGRDLIDGAGDDVYEFAAPLEGLGTWTTTPRGRRAIPPRRAGTKGPGRPLPRPRRE